MNEQLAFTLAAASIGFVSAVFLCIGSTINTSVKILDQSTPYWDFSKPVASSLAAQRSQYVVGALLLLIAFLLQVAAALASSTTPSSLPLWLHTWRAIVLAVLVSTAPVAGVLSALIYKTTMSKVLRLEAARREEDKRTAKKMSHP